MSFHEVQFPPRLSFGSVGGPERMTQIVQISSGFEERSTAWQHSRRRYDAGIGLRNLDDLQDIVAFFEARMGQLYAFRWKDWADFKSCKPSEVPGFEDQLIGTGDGETRVFQLQKTYASGDAAYTRPVKKPVEGTVHVGLQGDPLQQGEHFEIDPASGLITFAAAPELGAQVTAGFEFDTPVRFDTSSIRVSIDGFEAGEIPEVPVVEVRLQ